MVDQLTTRRPVQYKKHHSLQINDASDAQRADLRNEAVQSGVLHQTFERCEALLRSSAIARFPPLFRC